MLSYELFNLICSVIGIFLFIFALFFEIKILREIKSPKNKKAWIIGTILTIFFCSGYSLNILLIINSDYSLQMLIIGFVYLFGALFVVIINYISFYSEKKLNDMNLTLQEKIENKIREIKESEENFKHLTGKLSIGIIIFQGNKIIYANEIVEDILEYGRKEIMSFSIERLLKIIRHDVTNIGKQGIMIYKNKITESTPIENYRVITKSGKNKWLKLYSKSFQFNNKDAILFYFVDITPEKELEKKIVKSHEKFHDLLKTAPIGILELDFKNLRVSYMNNWMKKILGYTYKEINTFDLNLIKKVIHPADHHKVFNNKDKENKTPFSKKKEENFELRIISKDKKIKWVESHVNREYEGERLTILRIWFQDITDRKIAKQKLRHSEEKYRTITENSTVIISVLNEKMGYEYINNAYSKILGYNQEEMIGRKPIEIIHPDDRDKTKKIFMDGFEKGRGESELRIRRKDGKYIWVKNEGRTFIDSKGNKKALIIANEITERKLSENKLKESEEKYRLITENANDCICVLNERLKHEFINEKAYKRILGYDKEDMIGKDAFFFIHPDDRVNALEKSFEGIMKGYGQFNARVRHKNEFYLWFEIRGGTFPDSKGKTKVLAILRDITERMEAKKKIDDLNKELELLLDNVPVMIYYKDKMNNFMRVNKYLADTMNMSKEELEGKSCFKIYPKEAAKKHWEDDLEVIKSKNPKIDIEEQIYSKSGKQWILTSKIPVKNHTGEVVGIIGMSKDITKLKEAEKEKEKLLKKIKLQNKELKQLDKLKDEFFADAAHEFKTPLISIQGFTELLLKSKNLTQEEISDLETIHRNSVKLEKLIEEILNYSRLQANVIKLKEDTFKISTLIKLIKKDLQLELEKKNLEIKEYYNPDSEVILDKNQIMRILRNLISNAIKFSYPNSKIEIYSSISDNREWRFEIKDYGVGIKNEDLSNIFSRYGKLKQYNNELNPKGLGLGLTICKKIIEVYKGDIWAESDGLRSGSTFKFRIPLQKRISDEITIENN
ncbi:MAG: PAS domain S-box protein [Candidatus Lokiarchaeota archaeon]|nr:PAS domain S-box protein [Candidatus Lokiarchaeota archaeon]